MNDYDNSVDGVDQMVTDAVTQANVTTLANGPAVATDQAYFAHTQAHGVLFANMVGDQQRQSAAGLAAALTSAARIFGLADK
ncbi:MAG: cobalt transporter ApaG [Alphaproteobacteria bacterium]|nr:MAG: cobalt transporter ApaG [Alphaproteobacteria bacterium]